jgi:hypothetical protein
MVGMLTALAGTELWKRLEREGRIRCASSGDQFEGPNFEPAMDEVALLSGYQRLMASLYSADAYYARCHRLIERLGHSFAPMAKRPGGVRTMLRSMLHIGIASPRRGYYWKLLWRTLRIAPHAFPRAVALVIQGEHLIRYTAEHVLPRLDRARAKLEGHRAAAAALRLHAPVPQLA